MDDGKTVDMRRIGAMELLGIGGFSCFFGWMLVSYYWLFAEAIQDTPVAERDAIQLFVFAGLALGYLSLHLLAKNSRFDPFRLSALATDAALALLLPIAALFLGLGGASLTVSWLDASSRIRVKSFPRFTSLSLVGGGALFVLAAIVPEAVQPVCCIV